MSYLVSEQEVVLVAVVVVEMEEGEMVVGGWEGEAGWEGAGGWGAGAGAGVEAGGAGGGDVGGEVEVVIGVGTGVLPLLLFQL
jgi:hypothetical protein